MGDPENAALGAAVRVSADVEAASVTQWRGWLSGRLELVGASEPADVCVIEVERFSELGIDSVRSMRRERPETPVLVILPDLAGPGDIRLCFRAGAADVLAESEVETELEECVLRCAAACGAFRAAPFDRRAAPLQAVLGALRSSYDATLCALVTALDLREQETACHSQRVAVYSLLLGMRAGVEGDGLRDLFWGSLLHDIGKIGIPDAVLLKPGRLAEEEWAVMRRHTDMGAQILEGIAFLRAASHVPAAHHEAWDGSGYPLGREGRDIPLAARIFAVVDSYDAIRSERPYKPAESHETALERVRAAAGRRLDPGLVEHFVREPERSWTALAAAATESLGFEEALALCRGLALPR